ncbi:MAG: hypothetical protein ABR552_06105 [Actinomycetota bacterium]
MARWIAFAFGIFVVLGTSGSLTRTLIVPRADRSRLSTVVKDVVRAIFLGAASFARSYKSKDRILAYQAPMTLIMLLATWLGAYLLGFVLMLEPWTHAFGRALIESGSSMFTLGTAAPVHAGGIAIGYAAAAAGLITVALQIAYLPTLYSAFNRREMLVTLLQSRAGVPAWGPEILARHQMNGLTGSLGDLYSEWEAWAADVAETHANYPILLAFRSPHPLRSWVLALLAVIDSAALYNALCPSSAPFQTRLCIRMGFTAMRDIASAILLSFDPDPSPDAPIRLTRAEFDEGIARLREVDFPMERTPDEAWEHFRGWRVNYEALAYALADRVVAAPSLWSGPRKHVPDEVVRPLRPVDRRIDRKESMEAPPVQTEWRL